MELWYHRRVAKARNEVVVHQPGRLGLADIGVATSAFAGSSAVGGSSRGIVCEVCGGASNLVADPGNHYGRTAKVVQQLVTRCYQRGVKSRQEAGTHVDVERVLARRASKRNLVHRRGRAVVVRVRAAGRSNAGQHERFHGHLSITSAMKRHSNMNSEMRIV
jgi:hypothetical protein